MIQLLESLLGEVVYRPRTPSSCSDTTVGDIVSTNRSLIILYPLEELPHPEDGIYDDILALKNKLKK